MKVLIIEDESLAARRLSNLLHEIDPDIEIDGLLESVEESVEWLNARPAPELIFLDIHLEDGLSFDIFNRVTISSPVIFTTATDMVSTDFFRRHHIRYLLKPIIMSELKEMMKELEKHNSTVTEKLTYKLFEDLIQARNQDTGETKQKKSSL